MKGDSARIRCPAKVNLDLRILGRLPDGFHEIRTVFQAIDLWDEVEARPGPELALACDDPSVPRDGSNLVLRAARLLRERRGVSAGASLVLRKHIPVAGGLGGGSSDAAGTLVLLSRVWELPGETAASLAPLAAELGSDVPFFLVGGTALGTGRGEIIQPLRFPGPLPVVLGIPPFGLSTSEVYGVASRRLTHRGVGVTVRPSLGNLEQAKDFGSAKNDLEKAAFELRPELCAFRDALEEAGAERAMLSGSGSTVFGVFREGTSAEAAMGALAARFSSWRVVATRTVPSGVVLETGEGAMEGRPWK